MQKHVKLNRFMAVAMLSAMSLLAGIAYASGQATTVAQEKAEKSRNVPRPQGWSAETHGGKAAPNYDVVFPKDKVNQITIRITPEDWQAMQDNMTQLYGERGTGQRGGIGRASAPPFKGNLRGGFVSENPVWVEAAVEFEGKKWMDVGIRYKGDKSLKRLWKSSEDKLPFKLEFDHFEERHPEVNNQRFYGFKKLAFSSNFGDASAMRERVAYAILKEAGLVSSETGYYQVQLNYGQTPVILGLYTVIEVTDDTVIKRFFGHDNGNIYKADGQAASLAKGAFDGIRDSFRKENNKRMADWSDIEALYLVLHSGERTADPAVWRGKLEAIFDVNVFLKWLAISAVIQHWDSYGRAPHNYYLYNDPNTGRLTWISWDHNLVLGRRADEPLDKKEIDNNWPLIRYLLDDPTYSAKYVHNVCEANSRVFDADKLAKQYQTLAQLIAPYVAKESSEASFNAAVQQLTNSTYKRAKATDGFCKPRY